MIKNTKTQKKYTRIEYLQFKENEEKELVVSNWDFTKGAAGYLFRCYVLKENGEETDKVWTVWDYESTLILKKKLGVKFTSGTKLLKVKMVLNEEDEQSFEIS